MEFILRETITQFIQLMRTQFLANTAINTHPDYTEVAEMPACVLDEFSLVPNNTYRRIAYEHKLKGATEPDSNIALRRLSPEWYDLQFTATLIANAQNVLLTGVERFLQFRRINAYVLISDPAGDEDIELELTVGSPAAANTLNVNRSGVQAITTRFILSALPVFTGVVTEVPVAITREFTFKHKGGSQSEEVFVIPVP